MPFLKGSDGKSRSVRNPLEGETGDFSIGNISTSGSISGTVTFSPAVANNWSNANSITSVASALNALAEQAKNITAGTATFDFKGPYSNDANAAAGGVPIGGIYYNSSGGLVVRTT